MSIKSIRNAVGASDYMSDMEARRTFYFEFYIELGFSVRTIIADLNSLTSKELIEWFEAFA